MEKILLLESFSDIKPRVRDDLLIESFNNNPVIATIEFPCLPLDTETGNGRIYGSPVISLASQESNRKIKDKQVTLWCTADGHPEEEVPEPADSSHIVTESWIENGYLWSRALVIDTQRGRDFLTLIRLCESGNATGIGFSIRGTGALSGKNVTKYEYLGTDAVGIPSTGLKAKPIRIGTLEEKVSESLETKNKENLTENREPTKMSNQSLTNISSIQAILAESISKINATSSLIEASSIITRTESNLEKLTVIESSSGILSAGPILREWEESKKAVEEKLHPTKKETCTEELEGSDVNVSDENQNQTSVEESREKIKELEESLTLTTKSLAESINTSRKKSKELLSENTSLKESLEKVKQESLSSLMSSNTFKALAESNQRNYDSLKESSSKEITGLNEQISKLTKENLNLVKYGAAAKMAATHLASRIVKEQ